MRGYGRLALTDAALAPALAAVAAPPVAATASSWPWSLVKWLRATTIGTAEDDSSDDDDWRR